VRLPALWPVPVQQTDFLLSVTLVQSPLPLCTDGTERLHYNYNTLKGYPDGMNPVSTSGGMSPAPNPRVAVPPR